MRKLESVEEHLQEKLKDPSFREAYELEELKGKIALFVIQSRIKNKLSQRQLAKCAGITQQEVSRIENGEIGTLRMLCKVLYALGCGVEISFPKKHLCAA